MTMTLEQAQDLVKARIKTRKQTQSRRELLSWSRETANTVTSSCGRFMISEATRITRKGIAQAWSLFRPQIGVKPPVKIAGPFSSPTRARQAAQDFADGVPMQRDLA